MLESHTTPTPRRPDRRRPGHGRRVVWAALLLVGAVLVTDAVFGERGLLAWMHAEQQVASLEAAIARAEAHNQRLRDQVRHLREDPAAIEALARKELGLIRPGEKLFIIRDVPPPTRPTP